MRLVFTTDYPNMEVLLGLYSSWRCERVVSQETIQLDANGSHVVCPGDLDATLDSGNTVRLRTFHDDAHRHSVHAPMKLGVARTAGPHQLLLTMKHGDPKGGASELVRFRHLTAFCRDAGSACFQPYPALAP